MSLRAGLPLLAALGLATAGCILFGKGGAFDSDLGVEREREVTADVARQIRAQAPLMRDPILLAYLNELGQQIVRTTEPQPFIFRFAMIRDEELNAFTIGGGYVYINTGVFEQVGDVSELEGVLAHEIAHVRDRHIASHAEGEGITTLATLAAMAAVALAGADPNMMVLPQSLNVALQLKNTRRNEAEADRDGLGYMVRAGYAPRGMVRFFERILLQKPRSGETVPAYLFSHPAVEQRIAAAKLQIGQMTLPANLRTEESRLTAMQGRLANLLHPPAGGTGMQARPQFDRARSDPLLEAAEQARKGERPEAAERLLAQAGEAEPNDPRVPLARADLAEARRDWPAARVELERAFEIDPYEALVQYRLGHVHGRLGDRSQAVFYLEQAATTYRAGSAGRQRAEAEMDLLTFPVFDASGLGADAGQTGPAHFAAGATVRWSGKLARRFAKEDKLQVRWIAPDGSLAREQSAEPSGADVASELATSGQPVGAWQVEVLIRDVRVDLQRFELAPAS